MIRSRKCLWARTFNFRWTHSFFCHEFEGVCEWVCEYIRFQFCNLILHFMVSSCRVIFISQWMQFSSMNIHKSCTFRTFSTSTGYTQSLIHSCSFFFCVWVWFVFFSSHLQGLTIDVGWSTFKMKWRKKPRSMGLVSCSCYVLCLCPYLFVSMPDIFDAVTVKLLAPTIQESTTTQSVLYI